MITPLLPPQVPVMCNDRKGSFKVDSEGAKVLCSSDCCASKDLERRLFKADAWESHCGKGTAKKWKISIKVG